MTASNFFFRTTCRNDANPQCSRNCCIV